MVDIKLDCQQIFKLSWRAKLAYTSRIYLLIDLDRCEVGTTTQHRQAVEHPFQYVSRRRRSSLAIVHWCTRESISYPCVPKSKERLRDSLILVAIINSTLGVDDSSWFGSRNCRIFPGRVKVPSISIIKDLVTASYAQLTHISRQEMGAAPYLTELRIWYRIHAWASKSI